MSMTYRITRQIGIDAGHRVTNHHSGCKNLHGHRYTIEATVEGVLAQSGSQEGMAGGLDFSFLKEEMMREIHEPCDHGLILWIKDPFCSLLSTLESKLYFMDKVPTAENLAEHWGRRLVPRVVERSGGQARLVGLRVHETPNCFADWYPEN